MFRQRMLEGCSQSVLHQTQEFVVGRGSALSLQDRWDTDLKYQAPTECFVLFVFFPLPLPPSGDTV